MELCIVTDRDFNSEAFWHVVHEWEDIFSEYFELRYNSNKIQQFIRKRTKLRRLFIGKRKFGNNGKELKLCFVLDAKNYKLYVQKNIIPIFLDFPSYLIDEIIIATKKIPLFYVTCYDIYKEMIKRNCKNVKYIPLSISDKYYLKKVPSKTIDVIQFGRKNELLHNYMLRYCESHQGIDYVYQKDKKSLAYFSTQKGDLGCFDTRKEYFELLSKCKVSLVSSPAIDGTRDFGNGIDFITPRFYESAVNYCFMVGRYTENEESEMLKINSICDNIKNYEEFEKCMDKYLGSDEFFKKNEFEKFLERNITSIRCQTILDDIAQIQNERKKL